jgi:hypothetical protein
MNLAIINTSDMYVMNLGICCNLSRKLKYLQLPIHNGHDADTNLLLTTGKHIILNFYINFFSLYFDELRIQRRF